MKNLIPAAAFFCTIFLNAAGTFAGQWTEVPGGASPHPSALFGIAVVSADDIWAVGSWGQSGAQALIEHWDGTNWSVAAVQPPGTQLLGVAARSPSDVWAVGSIVVLGQQQTLVEHWNGRRWVVVPSPTLGTYDTLYAVCVISRNDAWAVGYSLTLGMAQVYILMHWDGTNWSLVNGPPANSSALRSLKAFATNDVWAVGYKDLESNQNTTTTSTFTLHWDGTAWSEVPSPNVGDANSLNGVDGATPNDVWAVGSTNLSALAMHWDGAVWTVVPTPVTSFYALTVLSSANIIAVGGSVAPSSARWDGAQWRVVPTPPVIDNYGFLSAISSRDGSMWAVGYQGFPSHSTSAYDLIFNWTR
jgi:hypothetical protein